MNKTDKNVSYLKENFSNEEIKNGKVMAIFSYIFPLVPYIIEKNNKWVRFHAIQGMNLLIFSLLSSIFITFFTNLLCNMYSYLWTIMGILSTAVYILIILLCLKGIINVVKGIAKKLPIVGSFRIIKK